MHARSPLVLLGCSLQGDDCRLLQTLVEKDAHILLLQEF